MATATFSERHPASGVDAAAAQRAAAWECRAAYRSMVIGGPLGYLLLRRAVLRLSLTFGNQTEATEALQSADLPHVSDQDAAGRAAEIDADRAELDAGAGRSDPHPQLLEKLRDVESQIKELRR